MLVFRLLLLLLLLPAFGRAETIDLPAAIRAAVTERPLTLGARQQTVAVEAAVGEARSRYWPQLVVQETFQRVDEPGGSLFLALNQARNVMIDRSYNLIHPEPQNDFETRLTLEQPLFDPDIYYGARAATVEAEAARADLRQRADEAGFAAFAAYLEVQRATAAQQWAASARTAAEEIARLTAEHQAAGLSLKADLLRANVHRAETERQELTVHNDLLLARRSLALAAGRSGGELDIARPLTAEDLPLPEEDATPTARADLAALAAREKAANLRLSRQRGEWLPTAGVGLYYAWHDENAPFGADGEAWGIRAGLSWELFDGLRRNSATARAAAERDAARALREEQLRQSRLAVSAAQLRATEAEAQYALSRQAADEAEESLRLTQQRYEAGLTDLSTMLETVTARDRARYDAIAAETRLLLARGNVRFQTGLFLRDYLDDKEILP